MALRTNRRRDRANDLVKVTRALFDERGVQDAPVEEIARLAGINRALVYRSFASKDELFVATVTDYLGELVERGRGVDDDRPPAELLRARLELFADFCLEHPAFLDCALSLLRRHASELEAEVSDGVWLRMAQRMAECLAPLSAVLAEGAASGAFAAVDDPDFAANRLYTAVLGTMHLARLGVGVREAAPGAPAPFALSPAQVRSACVADQLRAVGARQ